VLVVVYNVRVANEGSSLSDSLTGGGDCGSGVAEEPGPNILAHWASLVS
jgi:hypothetical protein